MITARENEVMKFTAWGASTKEIAGYLNISKITVQNHIHNIKDKLKIQKATEIAAYFFCHEFNISMDLNPLKRQIASVAMLLLILFEVFNFDGSNMRARRVRSGRKTKTEQFEEL